MVIKNMTPEIKKRLITLDGTLYMASNDYRYLLGKQPLIKPETSVKHKGQKWVPYADFERNYYRVRLTDCQFTQVMKFYTDNFGEQGVFCWVDFVRAAKYFVLTHYHWNLFKKYQEFIPERIPAQITYSDIAEFEIPENIAISLSRAYIKRKSFRFDYNCTKAFDRPVEDTI